MGPVVDAAVILAGAPIFRGATPEDFAELAAAARRRHYPKGSYLFREGDPAQSVFVVAEGEVQIVRTGPRGEEFVLESFVAGDAFGQLPMFDLSPVRVMNARAAQDSDCVVVARDALVRHLASRPKLLLRMLGTYSRWIRQRDLTASEMAFQNLTGKVACKLLDLLERQQPDGGAVSVRQHELAAMVGGSRENVNRALQRLLKDGDVRWVGRSLSVVEPDRLRERYGWSAPAEWVMSRAADRAAADTLGSAPR